MGKTFPDLIHDLLFTTRGLMATGVLLSLVTASVVGAIFVASKSKTKIQVTSGGATLIQIDGQDRSAVFLLPASQLWANTGLTVKKDDCLHIRATGQTNLAGHRLFESAAQDAIPPFPWVDANGNTEMPAFQTRLNQDIKRRQNLINPNFKPGVLLAYLAVENQDEPDFNNPRGLDKEKLYKIGSDFHLKTPDEGNFTLYLSINDTFLSPKDFEMYKATNDEEGFIDTPEERWERIESMQYWNIWFDDNLGELLVNIEYEKASEKGCEAAQ
jgi:hypothetical protein